MSQNELDELMKRVSPTALNQLKQIAEAVPTREDSPPPRVGTFRTSDPFAAPFLRADGSGSVALTEAPNDPGAHWLLPGPPSGESPFLMNLAAGDGAPRFLDPAGMQLGLKTSIRPPEYSGAMWTVVDEGNGLVRVKAKLNDQSFMLHGTPAASVLVMPYLAGPFGHWRWNDLGDPSVAARPAQITAQAFWWGFHFVVPEELMEVWTSAGIGLGAVLAAVAPETGPAAPFVWLAGAYLAAEFELAKRVNRGRGVYVSMLWVAPGIFLPTPV